MAPDRTTSWHIDEGKVETVADFIFLGSKTVAEFIFLGSKTLTAATKLKDTCSLEGRKAMKNLHSVLKSRDSLCYRGL